MPPGIVSLDNMIARGYLMVNTGAYAPALSLFDVLLEAYPELVAAQMAKGSACAMTGGGGLGTGEAGAAHHSKARGAARGRAPC